MTQVAAIAADDDACVDVFSAYRETISYIERLHRLMLDVIKDEFERLDQSEVNSVQALLLYNIGNEELTAGELKSRGYYQGTNVSYNLKKLVEGGFLHHERSSRDRRSVRIKLTEKGRGIRQIVADLYARHATEFAEKAGAGERVFDDLNEKMADLEHFWRRRIRYIY